MRLLIVDDQAVNVTVLEKILTQAGYIDVLATQEPDRAAELCRLHRPDLLLLDLHMPGTSGYDVLGSISDLIAAPNSLPVLVLTADATMDARHRALEMGARDFINKPIDRTELLLRVGNLLRARRLQQHLRHRNLFLDDAIRARTVELEQARLESLAVLATMAEYHDFSTYSHTQRVGHTAALIAEKLGLEVDFVATLRDAAPLHDVGKVGISDVILLKPQRLTLEERREMMRHVEIGARILQPAQSQVGLVGRAGRLPDQAPVWPPVRPPGRRRVRPHRPGRVAAGIAGGRSRPGQRAAGGLGRRGAGLEPRESPPPAELPGMDSNHRSAVQSRVSCH